MLMSASKDQPKEQQPNKKEVLSKKDLEYLMGVNQPTYRRVHGKIKNR